MADGRKYFVLCADNCKFESMTKEQILTAITQAIENGKITDVDTGFVTTLKEQNTGAGFTVWTGTQAQYNALSTKQENCLYIITDETTTADLLESVAECGEQVEALQTATDKQASDIKALQSITDDLRKRVGRTGVYNLLSFGSGRGKGETVLAPQMYENSVFLVYVSTDKNAKTGQQAIIATRSYDVSEDASGNPYIRVSGCGGWGFFQDSGVRREYSLVMDINPATDEVTIQDINFAEYINNDVPELSVRPAYIHAIKTLY